MPILFHRYYIYIISSEDISSIGHLPFFHVRSDPLKRTSLPTNPSRALGEHFPDQILRAIIVADEPEDVAHVHADAARVGFTPLELVHQPLVAKGCGV